MRHLRHVRQPALNLQARPPPWDSERTKTNTQVREALKELLDFRKGQAGRDNEKFYREFTADKA
jgi:hypothetical protein